MRKAKKIPAKRVVWKEDPQTTIEFQQKTIRDLNARIETLAGRLATSEELRAGDRLLITQLGEKVQSEGRRIETIQDASRKVRERMEITEIQLREKIAHLQGWQSRVREMESQGGAPVTQAFDPGGILYGEKV